MKFPEIIPANQCPTVFFGSCFIPDGGWLDRTFVKHLIELLVLENGEVNGKALLFSKCILGGEGFVFFHVAPFLGRWHFPV